MKKHFLFVSFFLVAFLLVSCNSNNDTSAQNALANNNDEVVSTKAETPSTPVTVTDYDGNVYKTVQIGNQLWMAENLKTTHFDNGESITHLAKTSDYTAWFKAYWEYPSEQTNGNTYGLLYNWKAVMHNASSSNRNPSGVQGICPNGWHVPSSAEWKQLGDYVSSQNEYLCGKNQESYAKALAGTTGWECSTNPCSVGYDQLKNNATQFNALPASLCYADSKNGLLDVIGYFPIGRMACFWTTTEKNDQSAYMCGFGSEDSVIVNTEMYITSGLSVRCVKD